MCILLTWPYAFIFAFINIIIYTHSISAKCLDDQMSLLLEFRASLEYNHSASSKLVHTDCCKWKGVECNDQDGRVIGLDLSNELITSRLDNSSALFRLNSLQNLNLAYNFGSGKIPSAFSKLSKLTYLNLSLCFTGEIPREIAYLVNLVTLDVSTPPDYGFPSVEYGFPSLVLPSITFRSIIQNMTHIKELYLDGVNISAGTVEWEALATSLPKLRVLSMSSCFVFTTGTVPSRLFQVSTLEILDLSLNVELEGTLPDFSKNGSLQELVLTYNKFSGILPSSIGNLKRLRKIDVSGCNFHGVIPGTMSSLDKLEYVDLSSNGFSGPIPSFSSAKNLTKLSLASNYLNGSITSTDWKTLLNLSAIDLSNNSFTRRIPISLFSLPSLQELVLGQNKFSGALNRLPNILSSTLKILDLGQNLLEGLIPKSALESRALEKLDLSKNNFKGKLNLGEILGILKNLTYLDLRQYSINSWESHATRILRHLLLSGEIPKSTQLQSFDASSYEGNLGLHGPPLTKISEKSKAPEHEEAEALEELDKFQMLKWMLDGAAVGFPVGVTIIVGPLLYIRRWRQWYYYHVDRLLMKIIKN